MNPPPPSLIQSLCRGAIGGTLVSLAGFLPWVLAGRPLTRAFGEAGMYMVCALVFIVLSGPLLHRLLGGQRSLGRFYVLFLIAYTLYSIGWIGGWMALRGEGAVMRGSVGLLLGCGAMAVILAFWFQAWRSFLGILLVLLTTQVLGYFAGDVSYGWIGRMAGDSKALNAVGQLSWGLFYGLGLGAGLGAALWMAQRRYLETEKAAEA